MQHSFSQKNNHHHNLYFTLYFFTFSHSFCNSGLGTRGALNEMGGRAYWADCCWEVDDDEDGTLFEPLPAPPLAPATPALGPKPKFWMDNCNCCSWCCACCWPLSEEPGLRDEVVLSWCGWEVHPTPAPTPETMTVDEIVVHPGTDPFAVIGVCCGVD